MIAQDKASDKGVSSNKIEVKGNVVLAKYFVYIEVYDFSVSEDEVVKVNGQQTVNQTTRLGLQIKFVDAETSQVIVVLLTIIREVAAIPPNVTKVAPVKFVPVIVTLVPPAVLPVNGEILVIAGGII